MDIKIDNNKIVNIDEKNWPDKITSMSINEGELHISNNSDDIKLLELDENLSMEIAGSLFVTGKLVELAKASGEYGQEIALPISGVEIAGLWIEAQPNTNKYEFWRCINSGAVDKDFSDFAPIEQVGRVFRIEDDKIVFSKKEGESIIPTKDAKILVPNIIVSVLKQGSNNAAYFEDKQGGFVSFRNVALSNIKSSFNSFYEVKMNNVVSVKGINLLYVTNVDLDNVLASNDSNYSSGLIVSYCSNISLIRIVAQSVKNYGVLCEYINNPVINNVTGIVFERNSNITYSIALDTVNGGDIKNLKAIGGALNIKNANGSNISDVSPIDDILLETNSAQGQANMNITNSSNVKVSGINIIKGGAAYKACVFVLNSSNIEVSGVESFNKNSNYVLMLQVAMNCVFSKFKVDGAINNNKAIYVDSRSHNNTFQNINIADVDVLKVGGIRSVFKGIKANDIKIFDGSYNTIASQLYTDDKDKGKLILHLTKNDSSVVKEGNPELLYKEGVIIRKNDVIDIKVPVVFGGIQITDVPTIEGGSSKLRVFFKITVGSYKSDYLILNKDNIKIVNENIKDAMFNMVVRIDGSAIDDDTKLKVNRIILPTQDGQIPYPVKYKKIVVNFDKTLRADNSAVFGLFYANSYSNGNATPLIDKNGNNMVGTIGSNNSIEFEYDYMYDNTSDRTPNEPFDIIAVMNSKKMAKPVEIKQTIDNGGISSITFNYHKDNAYDIYVESVKQ